jgi:hypothetical protein
MADLPGLDMSSSDPLVVSPKQFMLDNLIGSNIVSVAIDLSKLPEEALPRLGLLGRAIDVFPVGACLSFLLSPGEISEQYGCNQISDAGIVPLDIADCSDLFRRSYIKENLETFIIPGKEENNT